MRIDSEGQLSEKKELCSFLDVYLGARLYPQRQETWIQSFLKVNSTRHFQEEGLSYQTLKVLPAPPGGAFEIASVWIGSKGTYFSQSVSTLFT